MKCQNYDIEKPLEIADYKRFGFEIARKIMIIGPLDSGKTALCRKLSDYYCTGQFKPLRYFDLDIGQTSVGSPCTIGTALIGSQEELENLSTSKDILLGFIGSMYPYDAESKIYKAITTILDQIPEPENSIIIIDTPGFKDINKKVIRLKCKKIMLFSPDIVVFLPGTLKENKFEFFNSLRNITEKVGGKLLVFPSQNRDGKKTVSVRRTHHEKAFHYWFKEASFMKFPTSLLQLPPSCSKIHDIKERIMGFIDEKGLCTGIGILLEHADDKLSIYGKFRPGSNIASIEIGTRRFKTFNSKLPGHQLDFKIIRNDWLSVMKSK